MNDERRASLRLFGRVTPEVAEEATGHFRELLREVTRSVCGDPDALRWEIGPMRWVCDGCGSERPDEHADWVYIAPHDYCPDCQFAFAMEADS